MIPLQTSEQVVLGAAQLVGLAVLAGTIAAVVALTYRWYTRETIPAGLALLAGLAGVAVYLSVTAPLAEITETELSTLGGALYNIAAFVISAGGAAGGHRFGDGFGSDVLFGDPVTDVDEDVSELVKTVGRVTVVSLPERIDDVVGYDPVSPETRDALSGKRFVFPKKLTRTELDERLRSRLRSDYGVGTVDLELSPDGGIEHLGVGSKAAGIGPTLPPATNAVAIRADPAFNASTGDIVQVWEADSMRRVLTGELRGVAGEIVTVAINSADTPKIDPTREYRLVTLPVEDRPAREFASLLRAAEETFAEVTVEAGSPLHGMPVGALKSSIVSVRPEEREPAALPSREYVLSPGELIFAIGTPDTLRKLEQAADPLDPAVVAKASTPTPAEEPETASHPSQKSQDTDTGATSDPATADDPMATDDTGGQDSATADQSDGPPLDESTPAGSGETTPSPHESDGSDPEPATAGTAGETSFDELKAEYESGDGWADEDEKEEDDSEPIETLAGGSSDSDDSDSGDASFDELKEEFESGDADWEKDTAESSGGGTTEDSGGLGDGDDSDLVSLEDADISFDEDETNEDEPEEPGFEESLDSDGDGDGDDLDSGLGGDDGLDGGLGGDDGLDDFDEGLGGGGIGGIDEGLGADDDLTSLDVDDADDLSEIDADDEAGDDLFDDDPFDEDEKPLDTDEQETDDDEDEAAEDDEDEAAEDDEDEGDDDDSGGGSSFAQLKEEFESGDADWEDDVSDSPGGDMRLDE